MTDNSGCYDPAFLLASMRLGKITVDDVNRSCDLALVELGITPGQNDGKVRDWLLGIAIEFLAINEPAPSTAELLAASNGIVAALHEIDRHLETLFSARLSAPPNSRDQWELWTALHPAILTELQPEDATFEWDERDRFQAPHRGKFRRLAWRIEKLPVVRMLKDPPTTTRPVNPSIDKLIASLATLFADVTSAQPTASGKSSDPSYQPPFSRLVTALWPIVSAKPPPSNKVIGGALKRTNALLTQ